MRNSDGILFSSYANVSKLHEMVVYSTYDLRSYSYSVITKSTTRTTHQTKCDELADSLSHSCESGLYAIYLH